MQAVLANILYTLLFLPAAILRILLKSYKNPKYLERFGERLAIFENSEHKIDLWMHTVSVGEFLAAKTLIKKILKLKPGIKLLLTTTTPTGSGLVVDFINNHREYNIAHLYFPYDTRYITRRFVKKLKPKTAVFFETEIWPRIFNELKKNSIRLFIINARLSEKSFIGYNKFNKIIKNILSNVDYVAAQGEDDKNRFVNLGLDKNKAAVYGNIKYDFELPNDLAIISEQYKNYLGQNKTILVAASTHPGEEDIFLDIYKNIKDKFSELLLILVPRHPERTADIKKLVVDKNFTAETFSGSSIDTASISCSVTMGTNKNIFIVDTIGKLLYFYNIADLVFVGGSMVDTGGHNPIEPAALHKAIIMGPNYHNFTDIAKSFVKADGIEIAKDKPDLENKIINLLSDTDRRNKLAANAYNNINQHKNVIQKYLDLILEGL